MTRDEMSFGGVLRKWRVPLDGIVDAQGSEQILTVALSGQSSRLEFEVEEAHLTARLPSGTRTVLLGPDDLAARIKFELSSGVRADRHA